MKKKELDEVNLLDCRPERVLTWELSSDNFVNIFVPKFGNHFLGKWVMSKMKNPNMRVKLDELGSKVWLLIDGNSTVLEISDELLKNYGSTVEPVYQRVGLFVRQLSKNNFIKINY